MLQLPQSTMSRHLKTLSDAGWVTSRRDGTSRYYTLSLDDRARARRLVVAAPRTGQRDGRRRSGCAPVEKRPGTAAIEVAGILREHGRPVGQSARRSVWRRVILAGAARRCWTTSGLSATLDAEPVRSRARSRRLSARVIAVDRSGEMLQAARRRLRDFPTAEVRRGELEALPIADGELDAATLILVLHHLPDPGAALGEASRVLKKGGRLVICGHAAARSRGVPPADGARVARIQRGADARGC